MEFVLRWEGGATLTRDPDDPGGTTKYGISQRAHPDVDVAALTEPQAKRIYHADYWLEIDGDALPWPLCLAAMDYAVNSGVSRAENAMAVLACDPAGEPIVAAYELTAGRMAFLLDLADRRRASRKYVRGWMNRVSAVFEEIQAAQKETA
jgi:lysozyme family protein